MQTTTVEWEGSFIKNAYSLCFFRWAARKNAHKREDTARILSVITCIMKRWQAGCKIKETNIPLSMLIPLLRRSRRHLVASIHPSSLSQHPALSLGSGHALSPPLHTREQHHHYCKWQLAGGGGRTRCGERPALNFISSWCWMRSIDRVQSH